MPKPKISADELISKYNIDIEALYHEYMHNSGSNTAKKFGLISENYVKRILIDKGYDISSRNVSQSKKPKENVDLNSLYECYLHNGICYVAKSFGISTHDVINLLKANNYDLTKRDPAEKLKNKNGYSVAELVEKYNINVPDMYKVYMENGKQFTAKKFGLSN